MNYVRIDIPCLRCGKASLQLLREAMESDGFICPTCGEEIDLKTEEWRAFLGHAQQFYRRFSMYPSEK